MLIWSFTQQVSHINKRIQSMWIYGLITRQTHNLYYLPFSNSNKGSLSCTSLEIKKTYCVYLKTSWIHRILSKKDWIRNWEFIEKYSSLMFLEDTNIRSVLTYTWSLTYSEYIGWDVTRIYVIMVAVSNPKGSLRMQKRTRFCHNLYRLCSKGRQSKIQFSDGGPQSVKRRTK